MKAADVKAQINERIIKSLSEGKIPWLKPWTENGPRNLFSGRAYTGLNRLILGLSSYPLPFWATYRQYLAAGLQVQFGEHGTGIIYAGRTVKTDTKTDENGKETENKKQIRFLKAFVVFNIAQTDYQEKGYKLPDLKENAHLLGCDAVIQDYTDRHSIRVTAGNRAAYSPQMDIITCPEIGQFRTSEYYYATMFHECIHSTGPRLDRFKRTDPVCFGSDTYGREELVAEIGSAYLAALTGIDSTAIIQNQAAYLQNWATAIKADADLVMYAAGRAEKAADFMIGASAPVPTGAIGTDAAEEVTA
ncbi:ArdC family protein [Methanoregula formicica]|uniref:Antirestriction protein n=1 Tax=Methanoregula formicica (strain DSM 22288 / NBRC 105244 / SMSP) TaxID=593750 RepID=L0HK27_METFS|nr:ArdC-like ssDNA-binding domain-containing protein [Methanoregula formicica]AGB03424.1 antirestriction protein [Methanoregula formicica SMSP]